MEIIHRNLKSKMRFAISGILLFFTICFGASDEIKALAKSLKGDPCLIYDYVKNHIEYVPYKYPTKGPTGTYLDGCGNDLDQAALMVALLKESGFTTKTARCVRGYMLIPDADLANWYGIPNTTAAIDNLVSRESGAVLRAWVKVIFNGKTYYFDPAFKKYNVTSKIDIGSAMKINVNDISNYGTVGNDGGVTYVKNINRSSLVNNLKKYSTNLSNVLKSRYPNADISDILGTRTIVNEPLKPISNYVSLPYPVVSNTTEYDTFPSIWSPRFKVECGNISWQKSIPDIEGKRLTLTYDESKKVTLRLDGTIVASGTNADDSNLKLIYYYPQDTLPGRIKELPIASPGTYAIVYNFEGVTYSTERLMKHQKRIAQYVAEGKSPKSEEVIGETLHSIGLRYLRSCLRASQICDKLFDYKLYNVSFGFTGQNNSGYFVDFSTITVPYSRTNDTLTVEQKSAAVAINMFNSALEHAIINQTAGLDNSGISTSKGFEITNSIGKKIYYISSISQLNYLKKNNLIKNYSEYYLGNDTSLFEQNLNKNYQLIVPEDASIKIGTSRPVPVYVGYNPVSLSSTYIIAGGLNGGYSMAPNAQINALHVQKDINYSTLNCSNPYTSYNQISNIPKVTASDPVDMAGGAFTDNNTDLATAGGFPMAFTRQYSSNKNLEKSVLGYGWDHNYNIKLSVSSNSDAVMGSRRAIDAVPLIVAIYASTKLMASANDARNWATRSLIANWAVDQLLNNSVTISFGNNTMEFIKLSDGSYSPPPGINATLTINSDSTYTMTERSGTIYKFNTDNQIEIITDIDGNKAQFRYDSDKKLTLVYDDYGHWFSFGYLASGMLSLVTDQSSRSVRYTYDTAGDLVSFIDAENNSWTYTYDTRHRLLTKKDPLNIVNITNIYDGDKVSLQKSLLQNGSLATYKFFISGYRNILENDSGMQTVYTFDYKGRSIATQDQSGNVSTQVYDGENHTVESTDQCGRKTSFVYDRNNNLVEICRDSTKKSYFKYDTNFNLIERIDEMGRKTTMSYDSKRHLLQQTIYPDKNWQINTSYTYYSNGLLKTATNPKGVTETYYYDANGNKTHSKYGSDPEIKYEYNSFGILTKVTDQLNAAVTYTVDDRGLTTEIEDASGKKTNISYYQNGLTSQTTDRNNKTTNIAITPSGKTNKIVYSDGRQVVYTYNNLDQIVSISDSGKTTSFRYDANGRVISTTDIHGYTVSVQYYPDGQLKKLIYPGDFSITYTYDTLGRLQNIQDSLSNVLASYRYDASDLISDIQFGNSNKTVYQYDGAGRMTGLIHSDKSANFAEYQAVLDETGYPVSISENFPISSVATPGNMTYTYNTNGTRLTTAGGKNITYDNEGQTTAKGTETYTFNVRHQLETVTGSGYLYQYTYDALGHRVKAVRNGVTTKYVYGNGSRILAEADSAGVIKRYYIYGHGLIGFYVPGTGYFTCHHDLSGNMVFITDDTGAVAAKFLYTPFGEVIDRTISNPACDIPVGFAGAFGVLREPNGLYYMNARYYDPSIGRFLSEDPLGLGGGDLTLYSYAGNNPVVFVDPSGLCTVKNESNINWSVVGWGALEVAGGGVSLYSSGGTSALASVSLISIGISNISLGFTGNDSFEKMLNKQVNAVEFNNPKVKALFDYIVNKITPSLLPQVEPDNLFDNNK